MKKVIFDCDNTMGIKDYPMDDALALFYLLGNRESVDILGITTTFGNGKVSEVYPVTKSLVESLSLNIPVIKGSELDEDPKSDAAKFIVDTLNKYENKVTLIAVGSMTNLYGAYLIDNNIFKKAKEVILMGGVTEDLITHGKQLPELNFSCNYKASAVVLENCENLSIVTGNNCLESLVPKDEYIKELSKDNSKGGKFILDQSLYRFDYKLKKYGEEASYAWDVIATSYFLHKEFYEDNHFNIKISEDNLKTGYLEISTTGNKINLPKIKNKPEFRKDIYESWRNFI